jgi:purine/pyrimidine-nucleoside phosphorylase
MPDTIPQKLESVSVVPKANVYFDGKVVSHTVFMPGGQKKSIGLIYPGSFKFNTDGPEVMQMTTGSARVKLAGESQWKTYNAGTSFRVGGKSHFEIAVDSGIAEYICTFE